MLMNSNKVTSGAASAAPAIGGNAANKTIRQRFMKKIIKTTINLSDKWQHTSPKHIKGKPGKDDDEDDNDKDPLDRSQRELKKLIDIQEIVIVNCEGDGKPIKSKQMIMDELDQLKTEMTTILGESPQEYLDHALEQRGYSIERYNTLKSAYYNEQPTVLQQASYGLRIIEFVDKSDEEGLESCLIAGIHSNPCNEYNQSILHHVCKNGNMALLDVLLDNDCNVQCCDDFGKTPLHEACSCNIICFDVIETLMMNDPYLFYMADNNGKLPLEYVNPEFWYDYMMFLDARVDRYWPFINSTTNTNIRNHNDNKKMLNCKQPPLSLEEPNTRLTIDPSIPLSTELAWMVAAGVIEPEEATSYMDEKILQHNLPFIHKRLNQMAFEEEMKAEKLLNDNYRCTKNNHTEVINEDLTV